MTSAGSERRLAIIHRVIVPDERCPKEYAVLLTDRRSIFIRQEKSRSSFVLRGEMRYGTALVTDITPKTLEDYADTSLETLMADPANIAVRHEDITSLVMKREELGFRLRDLFVWLTMRRQGEIFQVFCFDASYRLNHDRQARIKFYMVPLGAYFKPRRQTASRGTILREYALDALELFREAIPADVIDASRGG
jgi:hypothetical protein